MVLLAVDAVHRGHVWRYIEPVDASLALVHLGAEGAAVGRQLGVQDRAAHGWAAESFGRRRHEHLELVLTEALEGADGDASCYAGEDADAQRGNAAEVVGDELDGRASEGEDEHLPALASSLATAAISSGELRAKEQAVARARIWAAGPAAVIRAGMVGRSARWEPRAQRRRPAV